MRIECQGIGEGWLEIAEESRRHRRMRIEHVALWTTDLERGKQFNASYFRTAQRKRFGAVVLANL
jgi:hypothetical protein